MPSCKLKKWGDIKHNIATLNKPIFDIFENIGCDDVQVYEVNYPYGFLIGDEKYLYLPDEEGNIQNIEAAEYPYMILVEKQLELYLETEQRVIPDCLYEPGNFMPMTVGLTQNDLTLKPSVPFKLVSGARSISMMPLYKNSKEFYSLQRKYNIDNVDAENTMDHFSVFKAISDEIKPDWHSKLYVFTSKFTKKIKTEERWQGLRVYLLKQSIRLNSFNSNAMYIDYALTEILTSKKISMRPFSIELVKQIIFIALGARTAFKPLINDELMPVNALTSAFIDNFKTTTSPVFIGPTINKQLSSEILYLPIPYFQYSINDPKKFRPVFYLHEIYSYIDVILKELGRHKLTQECIYGRMNNDIVLKYYTDRASNNEHVRPIKDIIKDDKRFQLLVERSSSSSVSGLCSLSPFSKALIGIQFNYEQEE